MVPNILYLQVVMLNRCDGWDFSYLHHRLMVCILLSKVIFTTGVRCGLRDRESGASLMLPLIHLAVKLNTMSRDFMRWRHGLSFSVSDDCSELELQGCDLVE